MKRPSVRRVLRTIGAVFVVVLGMVATGGAILGVRVLSRKPLKAVQSTTHATIERRRCLECHAPIADEWRHSFHFKSVTGPYWEDVRRLGYAQFFDGLRKRCMDCHAPANVLDLADPTVRVVARDAALGVECTPNVLREPEGIIPSLRSDDVGLGVDCVACHVSRRGIMGAGRRPTWEHETIADPRFQDPMLTSEALCRICHRSAVDAWKRTRFFAEGVTCLDCHMPSVRAASVADGAERPRRSHRFPADKDEDTLRKAFSASLRIEQGGRATFRIVNDGVGHFLPSGGNWVSVQLRARDGAGRVLREHTEDFGREEALLLDFWPFGADSRIPSGEQREVLFPLPEGRGVIEAVVRYHDWMQAKRTVLTLKEDY